MLDFFAGRMLLTKERPEFAAQVPAGSDESRTYSLDGEQSGTGVSIRVGGSLKKESDTYKGDKKGEGTQKFFHAVCRLQP